MDCFSQLKDVRSGGIVALVSCWRRCLPPNWQTPHLPVRRDNKDVDVLADVFPALATDWLERSLWRQDDWTTARLVATNWGDPLFVSLFSRRHSSTHWQLSWAASEPTKNVAIDSPYATPTPAKCRFTRAANVTAVESQQISRKWLVFQCSQNTVHFLFLIMLITSVIIIWATSRAF